jgi:MFS family permease
MWKSLQSVASLMLSYGLLLVANAMFGTLLGLRSKLEGFSTETVGFVMAGYFVGMLLGAIYAVRAVGAVGHIRAFAAFASIMSVAVLSHLLRVDPVTWFFLRLIAGFCMAGMVMVVESWLNERATNTTRGQIFSLYMMVNYLGSGIGQFTLTFGDPAEFELFVIASIIFSIALVPVLMTSASAPRPVAPQRMPFRELFAISPLGVVATVCAGLANSSLNSLGPVFARDTGLSIAEISTFMAVVLVGGMVLQYPVGRLSDRLDRRSILLITAAASSLACLGIVAASSMSVLWLFAAGALYGSFCYTIYPLAAAQVNDLADPERLVQVSAGILIAYGGGAIMGPIIAGQLMGAYGAPALFLMTAVVTGFLALFTAWRMIRRNRGSKAKTTYLPLGTLGLSGKQFYAATLGSILKTRRAAPPTQAGGQDVDQK